MTKTSADLAGFRFEQVKDTGDEMMLPGALKYGGLPAFAALSAPGKLYLHNAKGAGDLKLVDAEDEDAAEVTVNLPLLRRYRENVAAFRASLEQFCVRRGVTYVAATTDVPFDRLVLDALRRRGLVR